MFDMLDNRLDFRRFRIELSGWSPLEVMVSRMDHCETGFATLLLVSVTVCAYVATPIEQHCNCMCHNSAHVLVLNEVFLIYFFLLKIINFSNIIITYYFLLDLSRGLGL